MDLTAETKAIFAPAISECGTFAPKEATVHYGETETTPQLPWFKKEPSNQAHATIVIQLAILASCTTSVYSCSSSCDKTCSADDSFCVSGEGSVCTCIGFIGGKAGMLAFGLLVIIPCIYKCVKGNGEEEVRVVSVVVSAKYTNPALCRKSLSQS